MNKLKELEDVLSTSLENYFRAQHVFSALRIKTYPHLYDCAVELKFYINCERTDIQIGRILPSFGINLSNSYLSPVKDVLFADFLIGERSIMVTLEKAYEVLAQLKLEGY